MLENNNVLKLSLYQGKVLFFEKLMSGNFTNQTIEVRSILPRNINKFQKILSKTSYDTTFQVGKDDEIDFLYYNDMLLNTYPEEYYESLVYSPEIVTKEIGEWKMSGVEFKISLQINNKLVVERDFYVKGFNPNSRYSYEITEAALQFCDEIEREVKWSDMNFMWEDYEKRMRFEEYVNGLGKEQ